jgi:hypothetical protein
VAAVARFRVAGVVFRTDGSVLVVGLLSFQYVGRVVCCCVASAVLVLPLPLLLLCGTAVHTMECGQCGMTVDCRTDVWRLLAVAHGVSLCFVFAARPLPRP